ncbi:unnamed protein product [Phaedon cochleariae]|uniref:TRUD domain-containing protein n=1 Tax=Phaedon cochleariae TaxID=80249 RepID=A0A9N9X5L7_PHACE|nr:unnamed protein product [Phaedon cochleariae]
MNSHEGTYNRRNRFTDKNRSRGFKHGGKGKPFNRNYKKKEYRHSEQLSEEDVGINEYLNDSEGFTGIIKARYSDFQVNEIDLDGNMAKLTNTRIPPDFFLKKIKVDFKDVEESPSQHIPQETWEGIRKVVLSEAHIEPVLLEMDGVSKEHRKEIHECVKCHFGKKIISSTLDREGKRFMQFKKYNKEDKHDTRLQWPEDKGEFVHFLVYKENMNTADACFELSQALKMSPSKFNHAGNKDRRSISTQWFSVKKVIPWKLAKRTEHIMKLKIGNYAFKDHPLKLGQLQGNKFRIALRNVTADDSILEEAVNRLKDNGFINYYGLQRFGNDKEVPTFKIGLSLLKGKWKEAIDLILKPKASDDPSSDQADLVRAKQIYAETGNAAEAFEVLGKNRTQDIEAKLLEGLKKGHQNEYVNALENVPRSMRLLYLHAFQSLLWNQMVSKRIKVFGMKPVEGDLVITNEVSIAIEEDDDEESSENEGPHEIKCKKEVRALSRDDLPNYTLYDIALPLPGYDIVYPDHMKQYYKEALEEYGLNLEMTKQKVKTYSLCGDYRKILERVKDFSWKVMKYNHPNDPLIRSDFEELKGYEERQSKEDGQYKALVLEFSLSPSGYATMAIRDMMKTNTSSSANTKLNDYHEKKVEKQNHASKMDKMEKEVIGNEEEEVEVEKAPANSLLADPQKYEEFKNSLFSNLGQSEKRSNEEADPQEVNKKQKTDEEVLIKSAASLI